MHKWMIFTIAMLLATGCGPKSQQAKVPPKGNNESVQNAETNNSSANDGESSDHGDDDQQTQTVVLNGSRRYQLEVETIPPDILLVYSKQWTFKEEIPSALLAKFKKHENFEVPRDDSFGAQESDLDEDQGHIRWQPDPDGTNIGATLWFANGENRKELVIGFDVVLDQTLGKDDEARDVSFDQLSAKFDLAGSAVSDIGWDDEALPDADSDDVEVEEFLQVSFIGQLSDESSKKISAANRLLSEEITTRFRAIARISFSNESHHGISLGWMGSENLDHELMILSDADDEPVSFRYRVSGQPFSLDMVRNQLSPEGWPMVLRGREYLGTANDSIYVLRPIEIILSRRPVAEEPAPDN